MVTKSEIIATLPKLSRTEVEQVLAVCQHILGAENAPTALQSAVFDALGAAMGLAMPFSALPPAVAGKYHQQLPILTNFLDNNFKGWADNKTKQIAFLRLIFSILKEDLVRIGIKPTYTTMVNNMHRMHVVIDDAFPGYREAGLGHIIVNRRVK